MHERIDSGEWVNPASINRPSSETISKNSRAARLREVDAGTWRNPGQTEEAKIINSLPHKHTGALASAIEKIGKGVSSADLTSEERAAHIAYRKELRGARKEDVNAWYRERYKRVKESMTDEEKEAQREKWRQDNKKRAEKKRKL